MGLPMHQIPLSGDTLVYGEDKIKMLGMNLKCSIVSHASCNFLMFLLCFGAIDTLNLTDDLSKVSWKHLDL